MSLVRKCDICGKLINKGDICTQIEKVSVCTKENDYGVPFDEIEDTMDICQDCWGMLIDGIKAKLARKEISKDTDKIFSDPWDPGVMKRRD